MLRINVDKACYVADLAIQLSGKVEPSLKGGDALSRGTADDPGDDDRLSPILDRPGDPTADHLRGFLTALGSDEIADLMAMVWLGREEIEPDDWEDACDRADEEVGRIDPVQALMEVPHLGEHLLTALEELGYECPEDRAEFGAGGPG